MNKPDCKQSSPINPKFRIRGRVKVFHSVRVLIIGPMADFDIMPVPSSSVSTNKPMPPSRMEALKIGNIMNANTVLKGVKENCFFLSTVMLMSILSEVLSILISDLTISNRESRPRVWTVVMSCSWFLFFYYS